MCIFVNCFDDCSEYNSRGEIDHWKEKLLNNTYMYSVLRFSQFGRAVKLLLHFCLAGMSFSFFAELQAFTEQN